MTFDPIDSYSYALMRDDCFDNLKRDFGVKSWSRGTHHISELERVLAFGTSRSRPHTDFSDSNGRLMGQGAWHIFDHDCIFKCESGMTFMMTLPYDSFDGFFETFYGVTRRYYKRKNEIIRMLNDPQKSRWAKEYKTPGWQKQFAITDQIDAVIVDDKYKIRENGDFAAIIAMRGTLSAMGLA